MLFYFNSQSLTEHLDLSLYIFEDENDVFNEFSDFLLADFNYWTIKKTFIFYLLITAIRQNRNTYHSRNTIKEYFWQ